MAEGVDHRPTDALDGVGVEVGPLGGVIASDRLDEPARPVTDCIFEFQQSGDFERQRACHLTHERCVLHDQLLLFFKCEAVERRLFGAGPGCRPLHRKLPLVGMTPNQVSCWLSIECMDCSGGAGDKSTLRP